MQAQKLEINGNGAGSERIIVGDATPWHGTLNIFDGGAIELTNAGSQVSITTF